MPRGRDHDRITKTFLGWNLPRVHRTMDYAVRVIGPNHQIVLHDRRALDAMELLYGKQGRVVAALHILQDLHIITEERSSETA
jgi:hypothetical protein